MCPLPYVPCHVCPAVCPLPCVPCRVCPAMCPLPWFTAPQAQKQQGEVTVNQMNLSWGWDCSSVKGACLGYTGLSTVAGMTNSEQQTSSSFDSVC